MTAADRQAFIVFQQLYLLRFFHILRLYQIHKALGLHNSLEKDAGTDAGLSSEIAPTEKDPTGHLTIIVPGTSTPIARSETPDWAARGSAFNEVVSNTFKEDARVLDWGGENDPKKRTEAAEKLKTMIEDYQREHPDDKRINIVAHSHGGNVVKEFTNLKGSQKIDVLVNLGTPNRDDYKINKDKVGFFLSVFSENDGVQKKGGYSYRPSRTSPFPGVSMPSLVKQEIGPAKREDKKANLNLEVSTVSSTLERVDSRYGSFWETKDLSEPMEIGHSDLHTPSVWNVIENKVPELKW